MCVCSVSASEIGAVDPSRLSGRLRLHVFREGLWHSNARFDLVGPVAFPIQDSCHPI